MQKIILLIAGVMIVLLYIVLSHKPGEKPKEPVSLHALIVERSWQKTKGK